MKYDINIPYDFNDYKINGRLALRLKNGDDVYQCDVEFKGDYGDFPLMFKDLVNMINHKIKDCESEVY